jgi:aminoglycoside 2'-N-acetyltransferase I
LVKTFDLHVADRAQPGEFLLQVGHTAEIDASILAQARQMLDLAFEEDFSDHDWEHSLGGMHAIAGHGATVIGHASVIQRRLVHRGVALRTGYVEGVGVHPDWQRHGVGTQLMNALERIIESAYDIGALGATDEAVRMYENSGWVRWLGRTSALTPSGVERTLDADDCVYVLPLRCTLDLSGELTCDWRDGDVW